MENNRTMNVSRLKRHSTLPASKLAGTFVRSLPEAISPRKAVFLLGYQRGKRTVFTVKPWVRGTTDNPVKARSLKLVAADTYDQGDRTTWPDSRLIDAVRSNPPDDAAFTALAERYRENLCSRCVKLTMNQVKADDLAQDTWQRIMRSRHRLNPEGNFLAYLLTIATNLWRDAMRPAKRAGSMAEHRLISLNEPAGGDKAEGMMLIELLPDPNSARDLERLALLSEVRQALGHLTPHLHDVLVSRFDLDESCAEIGLRYGRTEQTVSGWIRRGIRQLKFHL